MNLSHPPEIDESSVSPGFQANAADEKQFISRILAGRYGRPEIVCRGGVVTASAALLCFFWSLALTDRGLSSLADPLGWSAAVLFALATSLWWTFRQRAQTTDSPPPGATEPYEGVLYPQLETGERVVEELDIALPTWTGVTRLSGAMQALWGLMLSGLPIATLLGPGGEGAVPTGMLLWVLGFTVCGALIFGRGVRDLTSLQYAQRLVLTDRRLVLIASPGAATSRYLSALRHRPVVVRRSARLATLALDHPRLLSAGLLPLRCLWGSDDVPVERAERWAQTLSALHRGLATSDPPHSD